MNQELHVVLGTGPVGLTLAERLVARGHRVRTVNRSGGGERIAGSVRVAADVTDRVKLAEVVEGADVVYNCTHVPYQLQPQVLPVIQDALLDVVGRSGAKLVTVETLNQYGPTGGVPMTERTPLAAPGPKGKTRAAITERYLAAHQRGDVRVALGMAADFFGPRVLLSSLGVSVFPAALTGEARLGLGDIDLPKSYTYVPDLAAGLAVLGSDERALGKLWHLPVDGPYTTRQIHDVIGDLTGEPTQITVQREPGPFGPYDEEFMAEYRELFYWHTEPFVMDDSLYTSTFGVRATPMREALAKTLAWFAHSVRKGQ
ncbi:NAD-dependent epimerase/dehydratase family protein [Amycolatopsis sp. NPDC059027]|uniref:NAD-dependent epimerase/dehydratase family protein n=1 Tax=Amycolatopsis sp. NPDC059027 TaxID=3346709 RepID=UPI00366B53BD